MPQVHAQDAASLQARHLALQPEHRINAWYEAIESYPLQLHELERGEYLGMKHNEIRRQQNF